MMPIRRAGKQFVSFAFESSVLRMAIKFYNFFSEIPPPLISAVRAVIFECILINNFWFLFSLPFPVFWEPPTLQHQMIQINFKNYYWNVQKRSQPKRKQSNHQRVGMVSERLVIRSHCLCILSISLFLFEISYSIKEQAISQRHFMIYLIFFIAISNFNKRYTLQHYIILIVAPLFIIPGYR